MQESTHLVSLSPRMGSWPLIKGNRQHLCHFFGGVREKR